MEHIFVVGQTIAVVNDPNSIYFNVKLANLIGISNGTFTIPDLKNNGDPKLTLMPVIKYNDYMVWED